MINKIIESINNFPERNAFFIKDKFYTYAPAWDRRFQI